MFARIAILFYKFLIKLYSSFQKLITHKEREAKMDLRLNNNDDHGSYFYDEWASAVGERQLDFEEEEYWRQKKEEEEKEREEEAAAKLLKIQNEFFNFVEHSEDTLCRPRKGKKAEYDRLHKNGQLSNRSSCEHHQGRRPRYKRPWRQTLAHRIGQRKSYYQAA